MATVSTIPGNGNVMSLLYRSSSWSIQLTGDVTADIFVAELVASTTITLGTSATYDSTYDTTTVVITLSTPQALTLSLGTYTWSITQTTSGNTRPVAQGEWAVVSGNVVFNPPLVGYPSGPFNFNSIYWNGGTNSTGASTGQDGTNYIPYVDSGGRMRVGATDGLVVSTNATAPTDDITGTVIRAVGVDGQNASIALDSFNFQSTFVQRRANGTNASKSNLLATNIIGVWGVRGYVLTGYTGANRGAIQFKAPADWSDTSQPTTVETLLTPRGSTGAVMVKKINDIGINSYVAGSAVASAVSITPTGPIFHVTGVAAIATIVAPLDSLQTSQITIIPDGIFTWTTAGNIALAGTAVVSKALSFYYDSGTSKWYPSYV